MPSPILLVGLSTRALAESAVRGGYREQIVTLDYFGDRDQRAAVQNHALLRDFDLPFSAEGLLQASRDLDYSAVVYISNLENHPAVVTALAEGRILLGNSSETLAQVRDWGVLRAVCREEDIPFPPTLLPGEEGEADPQTTWLRKPWRSGGGHGIGRWDGAPLRKGREFIQARLAGRPASAAFVADGRRSLIIGLTEQLIGRAELGGRGFGWCGNLLPLPTGVWSTILPTVEGIAARLTRRFRLRGVNGIDLVIGETPAGEPVPYLIEVNPRYTASMELIERAYGLNLFSLHVAALDGRLPDFDLPEQSGGPYFGKGIVYARRRVTVPESEVAQWTIQGRRDVPHPGETIEAGHPICTVLAEGETRAACWQRLLSSAAAVRREVGDE